MHIWSLVNAGDIEPGKGFGPGPGCDEFRLAHLPNLNGPPYIFTASQ